MLLTRFVRSTSAHLPIPEPPLPPHTSVDCSPSVSEHRADLCLAMVPVILCSHMSATDAASDIRCSVVRRSFRDTDESSAVTYAAQREEDHGIYRVRGCTAILAVP